MPYKEIYLSRELVKAITGLFPAFQWDEGTAFGYNGNYTFHAVFQTFAPQSNELLQEATANQKQEFGALINRLVEMGGDCENAVSTGFLEARLAVGCTKTC